MVDPKWSCSDGRSKEISCYSPKDILIPLPRIPFSLLRRATGLLRPRSPDILPSLSFVRPILPRPSWAGAICTGDFLRLLGIPGCAIDSPTFFLYLLCCYGVTGWTTDSSTSDTSHFGANSSVFTMWSGGASLHRVGEHLSGLWGRFFACYPSSVRLHAVSPRPGLVKLLALSNFPAYVHCDPCFTGHYGQCCLVYFLILCVIGDSFSLIECASCHRYLEPNGFSLRLSSFFVYHWCDRPPYLAFRVSCFICCSTDGLWIEILSIFSNQPIYRCWQSNRPDNTFVELCIIQIKKYMQWQSRNLIDVFWKHL